MAIATACAWGLPAARSVRMLEEMVDWDLPDFSGMRRTPWRGGAEPKPSLSQDAMAKHDAASEVGGVVAARWHGRGDGVRTGVVSAAVAEEGESFA